MGARRKAGWWWGHSPLEPHRRQEEPHPQFFRRAGHARVLRQPSRCASGHAPYQIKGSVDGRRGSRIGRPVGGGKGGTAEPQASRMGASVGVCTR